MNIRIKLETDIAINKAVLETINSENMEDIFYIIEEFTSKAKGYAKEVKEIKKRESMPFDIG